MGLLLLSVWLVLSIINPQIADLSALKFTELKPDDKTLKAVADDRAKRKEIAQRLEKDAEAFANQILKNFDVEGDDAFESQGDSRDASYMLSFERKAYAKACRDAGKTFVHQKVRLCKNKKTGEIRPERKLLGCTSKETEDRFLNEIICYEKR